MMTLRSRLGLSLHRYHPTQRPSPSLRPMRLPMVRVPHSMDRIRATSNGITDQCAGTLCSAIPKTCVRRRCHKLSGTPTGLLPETQHYAVLPEYSLGLSPAIIMAYPGATPHSRSRSDPMPSQTTARTIMRTMGTMRGMYDNHHGHPNVSVRHASLHVSVRVSCSRLCCMSHCLEVTGMDGWTVFTQNLL